MTYETDNNELQYINVNRAQRRLLKVISKVPYEKSSHDFHMDRIWHFDGAYDNFPLMGVLFALL